MRFDLDYFGEIWRFFFFFLSKQGYTANIWYDKIKPSVSKSCVQTVYKVHWKLPFISSRRMFYEQIVNEHHSARSWNTKWQTCRLELHLRGVPVVLKADYKCTMSYSSLWHIVLINRYSKPKGHFSSINLIEIWNTSLLNDQSCELWQFQVSSIDLQHPWIPERFMKE